MVFSDYVCEPTSGDRRKPVTGFVGDDRCGETPVPISNTVVKPVPPMILPSGKVGHCRLFDPAQGNLGRVAFLPQFIGFQQRDLLGVRKFRFGLFMRPIVLWGEYLMPLLRLFTWRRLSTLRGYGGYQAGSPVHKPG